MKFKENLVVLQCVAIASISPIVVAEKVDGDRLETVVVVGSTTNVDISSDDMQRRQANDLDDVFRLTPSVTVGGSVGIAQKVYIRGLEDTLLNVTVDGAPQTGTLFHHIGRVSVEPELLERVELQSGAGEATSGFGAIGGAIRFRTVDADDLLDTDQQFGGFFKLGYFSNNGIKSSQTVYGRLNNDWSLLGSQVRVDRDDMVDGNGDDIRATAAEQALTFIKLSGQINDQQHLNVSHERRVEEGEFGQRPNWTVSVDETLYSARSERETSVINYQFSANEYVNLEASVYHTNTQFLQNVENRWGLYGGEVTTSGFDLRNTTRLSAHDITYGLEYRDDSVVSEYLDGDEACANWAWDAAICAFEEEGSVLGAYIQDHYQMSDSFLLSLGLRYDKYDLEQITYNEDTSSSGVSANIGARYDISNTVQLTAGYAQALRGKEIGDAFTLEKRPGRVSIADDLNAEKVNNSEIGLTYDNTDLRAGISYYHMIIDDVILDQLGTGELPQDAIYYENVGEFKAKGIELSLGYSFDNINADIFYVTNDSTLNGHPVEGYEHIGLANSSGDTWTFNLHYQATASLVMGWSLRFVEDLNNIEVLHRAKEIGWIDELQTIDKPGYSVHDIYLSYSLLNDDAMTVGISIQNVLNEQYRNHASVGDYSDIAGWEDVVGAYDAGRDIRLNIAYAF